MRLNMLNRSLFSMTLFFSLSLSALAETPVPATGTTEKTADVGAAEKAPEGTTPAPVENTANGQAAENGQAKEAEGSTAPANAVEQAGAADDTKSPSAVAEEKPAEKTPEPAKAIENKESAHSASHDEHAFTIENMWAASSGPVRAVLGTLLFMLVAAMGVGIERLITLMTAKSQSRKVASAVGPLLLEGKTKEALQACKGEDIKKSYLAHQLEAGLAEFAIREDHYGIEAVERAIDKHSIGETAALRKGLNILATVGSTAPFVGLVGTIFGIINAFSQIGAEGGADLTTLAPAIGEALITTAFGIIVAIVGVWLFNYFTAMIEGITNDMAESAQELMDWCHKRIIPKDNAAK